MSFQEFELSWKCVGFGFVFSSLDCIYKDVDCIRNPEFQG